MRRWQSEALVLLHCVSNNEMIVALLSPGEVAIVNRGGSGRRATGGQRSVWMSSALGAPGACVCVCAPGGKRKHGRRVWRRDHSAEREGTDRALLPPFPSALQSLPSGKSPLVQSCPALQHGHQAFNHQYHPPPIPPESHEHDQALYPTGARPACSL